jgi:hypothetical protein
VVVVVVAVVVIMVVIMVVVMVVVLVVILGHGNAKPRAHCVNIRRMIQYPPQ